MSYTTFSITDVQVPEQINADKENIPVRITVRNTGSMAGSEVIQLYVHDVECKFDRPQKELKGFSKVYLQPGEEKTVILELTKADLAGYYMEFGEWITQPGEFDILVGTSSRDIASVNRINVLCKDPFGWNGRASIGKIATNTDAVKIINRIIEDDILVLCHVALEFAPDRKSVV